MNKPLDPKAVRNLFDYVDGVLYWRESPCPRVRAGNVAGTRKRNGSVHVWRGSKTYPRSHLVWAWHHGEWPEQPYLLHRDRDTENDRIENLMPCSALERGMLRPTPDPERPLGTRRKQGRKRYDAIVRSMHVGSFATAEEAHAAYRAAHVEHYGEASPFYDGGLQMFVKQSRETSPPPLFFSQNGISAAEFQGVNDAAL